MIFNVKLVVYFLLFYNFALLLLLLLSHFSRVQLCVTPQTSAHQVLLPLGFSRQEHWSGLPFPSPTHESESEVTQSCPTLRNPMNCSPPGSSIHGIFQARVVEWGAIAFSMKRTLVFPILFSSYFLALITEEGCLISPCYSLEICIQMDMSFLFSFAFHFSSFHSYL